MEVVFALLIIIVMLFFAGIFNYRSAGKLADRMTRLYTEEKYGAENNKKG